MIYIQILGYFLLGIMFYELIFPLLNTIIEVLTLKLELFKAKSSLEITKINSKIKKETREEHTRVIGFTSNDYEEEDVEEEYYEEDD